MKVTLIIGAICAAACIGVGIYFYCAGQTLYFGILMFGAVLSFWPSLRQYLNLRKQEKEEKAKDELNRPKKK